MLTARLSVPKSPRGRRKDKRKPEESQRKIPGGIYRER